jgi:hypothetical protein
MLPEPARTDHRKLTFSGHCDMDNSGRVSDAGWGMDLELHSIRRTS